MRGLLLFFSALILNVAFASTPYHEHTLKNGLKIIVKEDHRAPVVVSMIWYKVGSADEPGGITGVSHVLEHMMFKGTPDNPAGVFSKTIAAHGGQENAFTFYDYTAYFQKLTTNKLPVSFRLEADRMKNLLLKPQDFQKELKVVQEERRMRVDDNPNGLTYERFQAAAHLSSPYHHPIIGWMNDLQNMQAQDLEAWYKTYYAPNNATLVVVGDVNPQHVFKMAKKYFGDIPKSLLPVVKPQRSPRSLGQRHVEVKVPAKLPIFLMGFNTPSRLTATSSWEPYALEVLSAILAGSNSSRLDSDLLRDKHIINSVGIDYDLYNRFDGLLTLQVVPAQGNTVEQVQQAIWKHIQALQQKPVTAKELQRVKTQVMASKTYERDSVFGQAMAIGMLESAGLSWQELDRYHQQIKAITPKQIQAVAKKYLQRNNLTVAVLKPQKIKVN